MKKLLYLSPLFLLLSCGPKKTYSYSPGDQADSTAVDQTDYSYRTYCASDSAVNHMHQFNIQNYYPTNLLNQDGWFCETCVYCGQEFMFNNDFECSKQSGTVCAFRSPETKQFTDFCVCYQDDEGNYQYRTVYRQDLSYVGVEEEDADSIN